MGKKKPRYWPELEDAYAFRVIDNHTHLPLTEREIPRDSAGVALPRIEQLVRAKAAGVDAIISSACDVEDILLAAEQFASFRPDAAPASTAPLPDVYFALGIHPNEAAVHAGYRDKSPDGLTPHVKDFHALSLDDAIGLVEETARANPQIVVAIGETGLDYFRTGDAGREDQRRAFAAHIALAKELDLPMQIHDRDAHADVVDVLLAEGAPERTVFHCFSGDAELACLCNEHGWYMSFAGPVTYPANDDLRAAVAAADESLLLVETDAPYLTPAPFRGRPNASYLVGLTLEKLAEVRGGDAPELAERIYATTRELYALT
ncbi:hypothetical protein BSZ39_05945 [Bowdeniella nasicola]|uniref:TatD DNase family protein n=1 Tax=Bowdeniella nasicola TaxID=208480 RepID=A0A1Q5Q2N1_9ACTO|nr:TatD family hydrolase [Bowdeniella nasicola]OKL54103.1 hypothetical protein BSZ39_05945 [Bowdeniella nasicola]